MVFVNLPSYYPDPQQLRDLAYQTHNRGPDTLHRFFIALLAGELPNSSMVLQALEHPVEFDLCAADPSELPPPVLDVASEALKPRRKRRPVVRRDDER